MARNYQERLAVAARNASKVVKPMSKTWPLGTKWFRRALKRLVAIWLLTEGYFPGLGRARRFCWSVLVKYRHDDCLSYAAGLSFWFLISLAPLATLFFKILVVFLGNDATNPQTRDVLMNVIPFVPEGFLAEAVGRSHGAGGAMGFLAWFVLLWGSIWGIWQLDTSLAHVFGVRINTQLQTRKNNILRHIGLMVAGLVTLALILALLVGGGVVRRLPLDQQHFLLSNLSVLIFFATAMLVLLYVPRLRIAFRHALFGALVSTVFWAAAKWGFRLYIDHALTWGIMYGSLLGIIAGLTFLYYTCAILLFGAVVTAAFTPKNSEE
jgi:membrane protein